MTSTDTLLPCPVPWCGSDVLEVVRSPWSRGYCITCQSCGVQSPSRETEAEATAAWNRRTPPTPATDEREAVAQWCSGCHEVRSVDCYRAGCPKSDTEEREAVARAIKGMLFRIWGSLYDDAATRLADAALSALAPVRAQEIAAARAEEQGYRHTQVAALNQVHAAEILAAEASERARIASNETAWLLERDYFGQLRYFSAACQDEAPTDWTPDNLQALRFARRIDAERFASREATDCIDIRVVEHMWCANEHGAGK